jgi:thiol-disulfide isomerase/thioredoxin
MTIIALLLASAGLVCLVMCMREIGGLMFAAAAGFFLLPFIYDGPGAPAGFVVQDEPQPAPRAEFKTAGGKLLTLADFRGRVVLLNLWTTSCVPCQSEIPSFDRLQAMYQGDGLAVLAVAIDSTGGNAVRRYFHSNGIRNLTPYVDDAGATGTAFNAFMSPMTLLIDRDGKVVGSMTGPTQWDSPDALALIRKYLDG